MTPTFFATPEEFGTWLQEHHEIATELLVGFHKKGTGKPSITWAESVEQALRFGWIDGVRRSLGDESYTIRFTPRKPTSNWSLVNVAKVEELKERGLMAPAGLRAFDAAQPGTHRCVLIRAQAARGPAATSSSGASGPTRPPGTGSAPAPRATAARPPTG